MRNFLILTGVLLVVQVAPGAESFEERLREGNALFRGGDLDGAMGAYRDLQVEEPDSEALHYALGCAHAEQANRLVKEAPDEAAQAFANARESFGAASWSRDADLRRHASFNDANTLAQMAMTLPKESEQEAVVRAFGTAIQAYEDLLRRFPDHAEARQNLDHLRYQLKKMLQNPPQEQPQQGEKQQEGEQEEGQDQQEQQQGEQGSSEEQQEQEQEQGQQQQQQQDPASSEDQQQQDQQEASQQEQEQEEQASSAQESETEPTPESGEEDESTPEAGAEQEQAESDTPLDRQSIEAILQSLEETDQREQRQLRTGPTDNRLRKEWW